MKKINEFLRKHKDVALATVGQDKKPKVRAFEIVGLDDQLNSLYFFTADDKEVYSQIKSNPHVELLAMEGSVSVRIAGMVHFDVPNSTAKDIYEGSPVLQHMYPDYKRVEYFRVLMESADFYDLSTDPPTEENYRLV
ncbi:MAG: pyridoxamine 5'-phosphate oxidase family protein [Candidatus Azobacteroides sp.]|nr:pyridoxamine 5'-phosphate oxidase family protein [Candidatus Azobacteroides sp.]